MADAIAPVPGSPEHDTVMAAKVDEAAAKSAQAANETGIKATKPDNVPDEYWDAETGAVNTEALLAAVTKATPADDDAAKAALAAEGFDYGDLSTEYNEAGELSAATYEKLAKAGFDKDVVDSHIAGQVALAEQFTARAFEAAGGKEQFTNMQEWARTGLSAAELNAYNNAVEGTEAEALQAVESLRSKFEGAYGRQPALLGGRNANAGSGGYASKAEMVAEMRDPRYAKDPAFRASVQHRVNSTTAF